MKQFLLLSLLTISGLQAAGSDDWLDAMDRQYGGASAPVAAPAPNVIQARQNAQESLPAKIKGLDGIVVEVPDAREFKTLKNMVEDLAVEGPIPMPYHSNVLQHAVWLYSDPNYFLPVTHEELTDQNIELKKLLEVVDYLDEERVLEKFYIAWLKHPDNREEEVHHNVQAEVILDQMGLGVGGLSEILTNRNIALPSEEVLALPNYERRHHHAVSIAYLRATGQMPDIINGILNLSNKHLGGSIQSHDLVNIPDIETVRTLHLENNQLRAVNLSELPALQSLYLSQNQLRAVNLSELPALRSLFLEGNQLRAVNLSDFPVLQSLNLSNNQLRAVNLSELPALQSLFLYDNQLRAVNLSELPALQSLYLNNNQLRAVNLSELPVLQTLLLENNQLREVNLSDFPALQTLLLYDNQLREISLSELPVLQTLFIHNNQPPFTAAKQAEIQAQVPHARVFFSNG